MLKSKEWPLIAFTLLTQAAAGMFSAMVVMRVLFSAHIPAAMQEPFARWTLVICLMLLALGSGIAARHLGHPLKMFRVINNLKSSYLSREMLLGGLFGGIVGVLALLVFIGVGTGIVQTAVSLVGLVCGLWLVHTVANVYLIRTVPAWHSPATPISFFLTMFILGLGSGAFLWTVISIGLDQQQHSDTIIFLQVASGVIVILLSVQIATFLLNLVALSWRGKSAISSLQTIAITYRRVFVLRIVLAILSQIPLVLLVGQGEGYAAPAALLIAGIALVLLWAGELLGRYLFYESHRRVGL